jgi:benzoyl-CoA 2,3-epoxidase subunit A
MATVVSRALLRQHLIDPEVCIRCNTCEAICPINAITHDDRNYVVDPAICNGCMACVPPCPTGAIDNWRRVRPDDTYSVEDQLTWGELPPTQVLDDPPADEQDVGEARELERVDAATAPSLPTSAREPPSLASGSTLPPWSAAHPYVNLYTPKARATATVVLNVNCTEAGFASETHHVVLNFQPLPFPVLEGQSLGILPPGVDPDGRPHRPRLYSVASSRDGEHPTRSHVALTVKRVTKDGDGRPVHGVASNYVCDLKVGDAVQVIGPFGTSFLMPNHEHSNLIMICTGTGSAPMRAMTERRRKLRKRGECPSGKLMLFFGARTRQELPYYGPLQSLPSDFIDVNLAFSRAPGQPKRHVQDLMRERSRELGELLMDPETFVYVCGIARMEAGVLLALRDAAEDAGLEWAGFSAALRREGRLHLETY